MSGEISPKIDSGRESGGRIATAGSDQARELSQSTFGNYKDFLKVLNSDLRQIPIPRGDTISAEELLGFASNPAHDARSRAAAKIAGQNYDELSRMAQLPGGDPGLHADSASTILDLSEGHTFWKKASTESLAGFETVLGATIAVGGACATVITSETPPLAVVMGATAFSGGVLAVVAGRAVINSPGEIDALSKYDQAKLSSWKEINQSGTV